MEGTGSHRLPFFCKRAHNDDGPRGTNQYLSLRRNWAGKLFSPPVRVCSRHYQIKLSKFCGYVMYRLAAIECKSAMQRTLPPTSSRHYSSSNNKSYGGQHQQQQQQQHHQQKDRQNGSLPPPPNAREAGFGKVILLLTPLAAVGGVITYSKYDNGFRKMVEKNVPGAESVIKVALQEEAPFQGITKNINESFDKVKSTFNSVSNSVNSVGDTVTGFFGSKKATEVKPADSIKKAEPKAQQIEAPKVKEAAPAAKSETKTAKIDAADPPPKPPAPKVVAALPQEVLELEKAIEVSAQIAIKEYNAAIAIIKTFNEDVRRVVDKAVEHGENSLWTTLKNRASARDTAVSSAERAAREAQENMERCEIALSKAATVKNQEKVEQVRDKIKKMVSHISKAKDELYRHKDTANVSDKYWRSVEQARNYFIDEIESIFPGINLSEKKMNLSTEDLDLFILHAYSHVVAYQKELQRLQTDGELRLKRAIDSLRGENSSEALRAQLEFHLEAEKRKLAVENQKKIFQIRADADKQLRMQLKKQTEAHTDHLKDVVAQRETDLTRNFKRELDDKLAAEKANYKLQLAAMLGKLRGMDAALAERAETERSANQAQALWAACQALWASVRTATPGVHYKDKLRPLKNEIHAIAKVAEGDELVIAVLKNMPKEAEERGVFPEDALRERFINVERIARRLAMVPENGTSLPIYFLSFLQSIFIMRPDNPITKEELDNKPFDFSKLDTYDILNRARYYVDRGDFLQALKYLNLLQGAPREVAGDWMKETRLMLETQQAANTLMAHAAASGLMYL